MSARVEVTLPAVTESDIFIPTPRPRTSSGKLVKFFPLRRLVIALLQQVPELNRSAYPQKLDRLLAEHFNVDIRVIQSCLKAMVDDEIIEVVRSSRFTIESIRLAKAYRFPEPEPDPEPEPEPTPPTEDDIETPTAALNGESDESRDIETAQLIEDLAAELAMESDRMALPRDLSDAFSLVIAVTKLHALPRRLDRQKLLEALAAARELAAREKAKRRIAEDRLSDEKEAHGRTRGELARAQENLRRMQRNFEEQLANAVRGIRDEHIDRTMREAPRAG